MEIQLFAPNVLHTTTNFGTSNFTIRGVGNNALAGSADAGVGIHFNHMYLNFSHLSQMEYFDAERVEILRGPQGTLYGRNTTGGVLNLITHRPEPDLGGFLDIEGGNYNSQKVKGAFNVPFTDRIFQRLAFFVLKRDGFTENLANGDDIDGRDMYAIRSSTLFELGDATDLSIVVNQFKEDSTRSRLGKPLCTKDPDGILGCLPGSLSFETPHGAATVDGALAGLTGLLPISGGQIIDPYADSINPSNLREAYLDFEPSNEIDDLIVLIELNHDFNDLTLTASLGHQENSDYSLSDQDQTIPSVDYNATATPIIFSPVAPRIGGTEVVRSVAIDETTASTEQQSIEFRLTSQYNGDWNFNAGFYALDYEIAGGYRLYTSALSYYSRNLDPELSRLSVDATFYGVKTWAAFNEVYYEFNDKTRVTFGWRYTQEEKEQDSRTTFADFADDLDAPYAHQEYRAIETTGKLGIDYAWDLGFTDETLIYGTLSRGYKGGGFNPPTVESSGISDVYAPEYNNAIEFGLKSTLLDYRLQANFAYFHYNYKGMQIAKTVEQTAVNENADTMLQGFEIELVAHPFSNFIVDFNFAWLETEIKDFKSIDVSDPAGTGSTEGVYALFGSNCLAPFTLVDGRPVCSNPGVEQVINGNALPYAPEASYKIGLVYYQQLSAGGEIGYRADHYWQNDYFSQVYNSKNDKIDSWSITNLNIFYVPPSEEWRASFFVKNLQDDDNITGQYVGDPITGLSRNVFILDPRTIGLSYSYYFRP